MFVHAIQGMRPNLVASTWNFANFQSSEHGGVSAIQMEFKTCKSHGKHGAGSGGVYINIGSVVVGGKLAAVTAETKWPDEEPSEKPVISRASHLNPVQDRDTGYKMPTGVAFQWQGPSLIAGAPEPLKAKLQVELGDVAHSNGLIEKVDVLAEIPYVLKVAVNYVAGTKPYIYQVSFFFVLILHLPLTRYSVVDEPCYPVGHRA
jgi:Svf1-like C-terminal lipocalin-like domain